MRNKASGIFWIGIALTLAVAAVAEDGNHGTIVTNLPAPALQASTVVNGELNPYGVAFVPSGFPAGGTIQAGDVLVSNFNGSTNLQGTGRTIARISPTGQTSTFFDGPGRLGALGLTTALGVLRQGFVLVGSLPNTSSGIGQGSLLVLDRHGSLVANLTDASLLDGPWDLTVNEGDNPQVFVSCVLNGTVTRLDLTVSKDSRGITVAHATRIASGYVNRLDPAALVVGPTGLAYDAARDILYVASTGDNATFAVANAGASQKDHGRGQTVFADQHHLHGPLGLVLAPNGDLIASNGDAVNPDPNHVNEIVEFTPSGRFKGQFALDNTGTPGGAFGIALSENGARFAAVDDNFNTLIVWNLGAMGND